MIDTVTMLMGLTMEIRMRWNDPRLTFANVVPGKKNPVPDETVGKLWLPMDHVIHDNAVIGRIFRDTVRNTFILPTADPIPLTGFEKFEEHLYSGEYNAIEMSQRFRIQYDCMFDLEKFPFDSQMCTFVMKMTLQENNSLALVQDETSIEYNGSLKINEFTIKQW